MRITPRFSGEIAHIPYVPSGKETEEPKPVQRPSIAKAWERMLQEGIPVQPRHYFPEAQLDTMITEIEARHPNVKIVKEPHEDDENELKLLTMPKKTYLQWYVPGRKGSWPKRPDMKTAVQHVDWEIIQSLREKHVVTADEYWSDAYL